MIYASEGGPGSEDPARDPDYNTGHRAQGAHGVIIMDGPKRSDGLGTNDDRRADAQAVAQNWKEVCATGQVDRHKRSFES